MNARNFVKGVNILAKYVDGDEHCICAEHDVLYFGPNNKNVVSEEDLVILEDSGWRFDDDVDAWRCFV